MNDNVKLFVTIAAGYVAGFILARMLAPALGFKLNYKFTGVQPYRSNRPMRQSSKNRFVNFPA